MPFASYIQTVAGSFSEFTNNLLLDCAKYFYDSVIMQQKERKALDRCFDDLLKDLYPSPGFLHSLLAEEILTEEQMDKIAVRDMFFAFTSNTVVLTAYRFCLRAYSAAAVNIDIELNSSNAWKTNEHNCISRHLN